MYHRSCYSLWDSLGFFPSNWVPVSGFVLQIDITSFTEGTDVSKLLFPYGPNLEEAIFCAVEWKLLSVKHCRGAEVTWIYSGCGLTLIKTKDHLHSHLFPLCWDEGENWKGESEKTCGWRWRQFNGESKIHACKQAKQNKEFPWAGRCSAMPRKAELCHRWGWLGKRNAVTLNILTSFFTQLCSMIMTSCGVALPPWVHSVGEVISFHLVQIQNLCRVLSD